MLYFKNKFDKRKKRVTKKVVTSAKLPILYINKTCKYIYLQVIDNKTFNVLASCDTKKNIINKSSSSVEAAYNIGKIIAKDLHSKKITNIVFNRSGYKYHGKIRAIAQALREEKIAC